MKTLKLLLILACLVMGLSSFAFGKTATGSAVPKKTVKNNKKILKSTKGAKVLPGPFRVKSVTFNIVSVNGKRYLAAGVIFNKNIDASTVNGDGVGEGGNLPAYESKLYQSPVQPPLELEEKIDTQRIKGIVD